MPRALCRLIHDQSPGRLVASFRHDYQEHDKNGEIPKYYGFMPLTAERFRQELVH